MTHIAITAGGTSENIDGIRKITNVSTGSLGWHCLEAVFAYFEQQNITDFQIHYIHTENALLKTLSETQYQKVNFVPVTDAESVFQAVDSLTKATPIDFFIHSMAISDFTFSYAVNIYRLSEEIEALQSSYGFTDDHVREVLSNPQTKFYGDEKISSKDDIIMGLKRTKKVIPIIKQNNPNTFLVGFKLLKGVNENELLEVANEMAEKNGCDMVFANQLAAISESNHTGILIKDSKIIARPVGKKKIARGIVNAMMG
ncbi:MAG: hypothetical protein GX102_00115 [Porphyromonadaceae bacterium]|nr:hypothetical protein [Porphyromonadaceae bacterium]